MLKSLLCSLFLSCSSFVAFADGAAQTEEISASEGRAMRAVVEAQLKALSSDKPSDAFSYATPAIKEQFHDAAAFAEMVRRSYPMLIKPASIGFIRPEASDGVVLQGVQIHDRDGKFWRALYELQRQPDRSWRINGCVVAPDDDSSTT
jgi:Domain of unknown function (DUF4864)